jgi:hypothetical protein
VWAVFGKVWTRWAYLQTFFTASMENGLVGRFGYGSYCILHIAGLKDETSVQSISGSKSDQILCICIEIIRHVRSTLLQPHKSCLTDLYLNTSVAPQTRGTKTHQHSRHPAVAISFSGRLEQPEERLSWLVPSGPADHPRAACASDDDWCSARRSAHHWWSASARRDGQREE